MEPPTDRLDLGVRRAIEIRDGVVQDPAVLAFQQRSDVPPHAAL